MLAGDPADGAVNLMKKSKILTMLPVLALLLTACGPQPESITSETVPEQPQPEQTPTVQTVDAGELFSQRDLEGSYTQEGSAVITLEGDTAHCGSDAVVIDGSTVTITDEGTYILRGSLDDGMVVVNTDKANKVQLVLEGACVHSEKSAAIYVLQADKVFITLAEGTENDLSNGGSFEAIDDNNIDAVIFSKEDLTLNGGGSLAITSPGGHGIVSKDELTVTGGSYHIQSASHGLDGKDSVCIAWADMDITAGKDGIHGENDEDAALGFVYIQDGSFTITAEGDGISAGAWMQLLDGSYTITTGGGSENAQAQVSDYWGMMGGGMPGMGGGMGGRPGGRGEPFPQAGDFQAIAPESGTKTEDAESIKAIKAGGALTVSGGSFTINAADDAIHSNAGLTVSGGSFSIATGDDGFHADGALTMSGGSVDIIQSYEGLEGMSVTVSAGDIRVVSTDDGINAAGGTDQSGFGGHRGGDMFKSSGDTSQYYIEISGGTVYINASGDGIDSNGSLTISGGHTTVCGPTQGDTAVLDYETTGTVTGGTFIGTGSYMMAQTFSSNVGQGIIALSVGSQSAGTEITVVDSEGNVLVSAQPELSYAILIVSSPQIISGESYTVTVGQLSDTFTAS